jgi:hypothetical protein
MKIYIATRFADRNRIRKLRDKIFAMGHEVVSTWLDEVKRGEGMSHEEFWKKLALKDMCEIASADLIIRDIHSISSTGGADTEVGLTLGGYHKHLLWIVGKPRNVFHTLADRQFTTWQGCMEALRRMPK